MKLIRASVTADCQVGIKAAEAETVPRTTPQSFAEPTGEPIFIAIEKTPGVIQQIASCCSTLSASYDGHNQELLRRALELPALPQSWKDGFRKSLDADA